jgi:hypothetical protein
MKVIELSIYLIFSVIFAISAAILYYITLINVAVIVAAKQYG